MPGKSTLWLTILLAGSLQQAAANGVYSFSTGSPDGRIGFGSRSSPSPEIESADDFIIAATTELLQGTFTGLLPGDAPLSIVSGVNVEIYEVFPSLSTTPPSGNVPTRTNSPSDNALTERSTATSDLSFTASILGAFGVSNTVLNGINAIPNQTTGGEGAASGEEVQFSFTLLTPIVLPAGHYFFVPQVNLSSGDFLWLSTAGPAQFTGDLQAWIRNANLAPDWLRVGTDIVGGTTPPKYDAAFSLDGQPVPEPATVGTGVAGFLALAAVAARRRRVRLG